MTDLDVAIKALQAVGGPRVHRLDDHEWGSCPVCDFDASRCDNVSPTYPGAIARAAVTLIATKMVNRMQFLHDNSPVGANDKDKGRHRDRP